MAQGGSGRERGLNNLTGRVPEIDNTGKRGLDKALRLLNPRPELLANDGQGTCGGPMETKLKDGLVYRDPFDPKSEHYWRMITE